MFGRESARKELGNLIEDLRRTNTSTDSSAPHSWLSSRFVIPVLDSFSAAAVSLSLYLVIVIKNDVFGVLSGEKETVMYDYRLLAVEYRDMLQFCNSFSRLLKGWLIYLYFDRYRIDVYCPIHKNQIFIIINESLVPDYMTLGGGYLLPNS